MYTITIKSVGYLIKRSYNSLSDYEYNVTLVLDLLNSLCIRYKKFVSGNNIHINIIFDISPVRGLIHIQ